MKSILLDTLRSTAFWAFLAVTILEVANTPLPEGAKWGAIAYVVFRTVGHIVRFVFPNPANPDGAAFSKD